MEDDREKNELMPVSEIVGMHALRTHAVSTVENVRSVVMHVLIARWHQLCSSHRHQLYQSDNCLLCEGLFKIRPVHCVRFHQANKSEFFLLTVEGSDLV